LYVDIRKGFFGAGARLEAGDFEARASRNRVGTFGGPVRRWYSSALSSRAYRAINLRGPTQFRLRFKVDDNDDRGNDFVSFYSGDAPRKVLRPELIVEYRVP
jgi:hypothetical protein